jgi:hypothetical protein
MKKFLFAALLIALFLTTAYSQSEVSKGNRQIYSPTQEEFSVEFPKFPSNRSAVDHKGYLIHGLYAALFDKTYYFIHSESEKSQTPFDSIREFIQTNAATSKAEDIQGFSGVVYTFRDADGFYNKILEIKAKRRIYLFHTLSETESSADVERFFDSIKFTDKINEKTESQIVTNPVAPENTNKIKVPVPGGGTGSGDGTTRSDGESINVPKPSSIQPEQTSPLKILSKPRVSYTDLARRFLITGSVQLRVTFSENGQIGTITPITRLPFGLTGNAIQAAEQIQFEPAVKDGKAYSVTKIVEYRFMLY